MNTKITKLKSPRKSHAKPSTIIKLAMTYLRPELYEDNKPNERCSQGASYFSLKYIILFNYAVFDKYIYKELASSYLEEYYELVNQNDIFLGMCMAYELTKSEGN